MTLRYQPAWPLGCFVRTIWYYEGYAQPHALERLMPDGMMGIVINLADDETRFYDRDHPVTFERLPGATVMGAQSRFFVIDTAEQRNVLGIQFHPGGAAPFLPMPPDELADQHLSLEEVCGCGLRERLLTTADPRQRCRIVEQALLSMAAGRLTLRPEIAFAAKSLEAGWKVSDVIAQTGFSARHFTEIFRTAVGLNPKTYSKIRRFQSVLRAIQTTPGPDWSDIALSCGYFDQSHFNHDFRAFSGITPSTYLTQKTEHLNHLPLD